MTATRSFSMPAPDTALNENDRLHRMARARRVKAWREATYWHAVAAYGYAKNAMPPCTVVLALPLRAIRQADPSNWTPTCKACIDGLVDAGWWENDTAAYVTLLEPILVVGALVVTITAKERAA